MKFIYALILILAVACTSSNKNEVSEVKTTPEVKIDNGIEIKLQTEPDTLKGSLKAFAEGRIGETSVQINYYSPAVRGRMIWGGLVAFDNVWVTGAHKATSFEFDKAVSIGGQEIPAGKYALFTIPGKEKWIIIINKNWNQHLADDYNTKDDVLRFEVIPQSTETNQERLMYAFEGNSIIIRWEKIKIEIPVQGKD